jgi:hypothetical protein
MSLLDKKLKNIELGLQECQILLNNISTEELIVRQPNSHFREPRQWNIPGLQTRVAKSHDLLTERQTWRGRMNNLLQEKDGLGEEVKELRSEIHRIYSELSTNAV